MNVYKITFSPTGGTSRVADILVNEFCTSDIPVKTVDLVKADFDFSSVKIQPDDICVIAVPVYGGRVAARTFIPSFRQRRQSSSCCGLWQP